MRKNSGSLSSFPSRELFQNTRQWQLAWKNKRKQQFELLLCNAAAALLQLCQRRRRSCGLKTRIEDKQI